MESKGKDTLYEAKLLIVGEGAGKTTLAKKIEDPAYELREDEVSTKGITYKGRFSSLFLARMGFDRRCSGFLGGDIGWLL